LIKALIAASWQAFNRPLPRKVVVPARTATDQRHLQKCAGDCGSDGHNSTECNTAHDKVEIHRQSNQANQVVSQLVHTVDWDGANDTADDDEATNLVFLNKSQMLKKPIVSFQSDGPTNTAFRQPFSPCPHLRLRCVLEPLTAHPVNGHPLLHFLLSRMSQPLMGCADKF
jgi:hypothetical protein